MTNPSMLDLVRDSLDPMETVHAVTVTGETEDATYLLVVRTAPHEGDLMLKERYFAVDEDEQEGWWMSNGINRRVTGDFSAFATSMVRSYARVQQVAKAQSDEDMDMPGRDPLLSDAREGRGSEVEFRLTSPLGEEPEEDEDELEETPISDRRHTVPEDADAEGEGRAANARESVDPEGGVQPTWVVCENCEQKAKRKDCVNLGGALGADLWVHESCPDEEEEGEDDE